jgi:aconitate hydratase
MTGLKDISRFELKTGNASFKIYRLDALGRHANLRMEKIPYSIRILLENALRHADSPAEDGRVLSLLRVATEKPSVFFYPARVLMQDFSGVPVLNDLAAMRAVAVRAGTDPSKINPVIPVDVVIDHSIQVDYAGTPDAFQKNTSLEYERNAERYRFLRWSSRALKNLRVIPPTNGIIHQINIEYLTSVVSTQNGEAFPDSVVGTDSHTTMVNGLGVLGWGVGGIEAAAAMLGEPVEIVLPEVVGFRLTGRMSEGVTATDLALTVTQMLRKKGVVEKFVEFYGAGLSDLNVADRAMISNMAPEGGATISYFPVDALTLRYLRETGRPEEQVELVETYFKTQGLFREDTSPDPVYAEMLELDLGTVEPSLAGPKRPQDRVALKMMKEKFNEAAGLAETRQNKAGRRLPDGAVVLAAITSCTNTSNPYGMIAAGLLAKKAREHGLEVPSFVKTSLSPGSRVVFEYLQKAGLTAPLEKLGFHLTGFGCMTCIGNSGPLPENVRLAAEEDGAQLAAVLSGNRNFEGRVSPLTRLNYLASPALVVAFALAGTVDIDMTSEPLGADPASRPIFLRDIWPTSQEIDTVIREVISPDIFKKSYAGIQSGGERWDDLTAPESSLYTWEQDSTYLREPPFFQLKNHGDGDLHGLRVLAKLGDSITTDHISPAGNISPNSVAGKYLQEMGVQPADFNSFGARRGNDHVMIRGTFGNPYLKNQLLNGQIGSLTRHLPDGDQMSIYDAAMAYKAEGVPLIILAGKEYGTGSSRDWAAKGALLLGVRAVIAESFERIHRSNLVGMGVLPLQFLPGENADSLELDGREVYSILFGGMPVSPGMKVQVLAKKEDGQQILFTTRLRVENETEAGYYSCGGIMNAALQKLISA